MDDSERQKSIDDLEILASQSWNSNQDHMGVFVRKFKRVWDDICTLYVDMYLDKHPISKVGKTFAVNSIINTNRPQYLHEYNFMNIIHSHFYNCRLMK